MRTASIIFIAILLSTGAALAQVTQPAITSLADPQTAVVIPIRGEINDYSRDAFMRRLAKARSMGAKVPGRLVSSAKSWLSHAGVDRKAGILPWQPPGAPTAFALRASQRRSALSRRGGRTSADGRRGAGRALGAAG